jgi:hypothetical protein
VSGHIDTVYQVSIFAERHSSSWQYWGENRR